MKPKVQCEIRSRHIVSPRSGTVRVQAEIANFFQAIESYPVRAAKHPGLTFQQHLSGMIMAHALRDDVGSSARPRQH